MEQAEERERQWGGGERRGARPWAEWPGCWGSCWRAGGGVHQLLGEADEVDWVLPGWLMELAEWEAWGWGLGDHSSKAGMSRENGIASCL